MAIKTGHSESKAHEMTCPIMLSQCQGAQCMAWQWERVHVTPLSGGDMIESNDTHGFCGMVATRTPTSR